MLTPIGHDHWRGICFVIFKQTWNGPLTSTPGTLNTFLVISWVKVLYTRLIRHNYNCLPNFSEIGTIILICNYISQKSLYHIIPFSEMWPPTLLFSNLQRSTVILHKNFSIFLHHLLRLKKKCKKCQVCKKCKLYLWCVF